MIGMMESRTKACWNCGNTMALRAYKHVEKVGKATITDETGFAYQCSDCGEVELTTDALAGYERRAIALVLRDGRNVVGSVLRRARKALGLKQTELATLLGCSPEYVSRVENGHNEYRQSELLAVVALLDGVERGTEDLHARLREMNGGDARPSLHEFSVKEEPSGPHRRTG